MAKTLSPTYVHHQNSLQTSVLAWQVTLYRHSLPFGLLTVELSAYPDGHPDRDTDLEGEIAHLKAKVDAGADFIVTQLFYDVDGFLQWLQKVRSKGRSRRNPFERNVLISLGIDVPIIPGIMPIQTYSSFQRLVKLCKARVPDFVMESLEPIRVCVRPSV